MKRCLECGELFVPDGSQVCENCEESNLAILVA